MLIRIICYCDSSFCSVRQFCTITFYAIASFSGFTASKRKAKRHIRRRRHAALDAKGLPEGLGLSPGEAHDNKLYPILLVGLRLKTMVLADRGYDADWIRALVNEQGAWANIPPKRNRRDPISFSPHLYRKRRLLPIGIWLAA